ncbi:MAG: hypothetical protein AAF846_09580 [Chloroflexota bacterium]
MRQSLNTSLTTRFVVIITTTLVSIIGIMTLLGLIFGDVPYAVPELVPVVGGTAGTIPTGLSAQVFIRLAVLVLAFSIIIGVVNLLLVNIQRTLHGPTISSKLNSFVVLGAFLVGIFATSNAELSNFLLEDIQTPIESALAGLIFFALVYGAFRMLKRQVTASAILFIVTVEIVLIAALPGDAFRVVSQLADWLFNVPVNAGARGILLGIALATLMTGLRVLIGQDRTYGE